MSSFQIKIEYTISLALDLQKETHFSTCCVPVILKLEFVSELPGGLIATQTCRFKCRISDSTGIGLGLAVCISNKFPFKVIPMLLGQGLDCILRTTAVY